MFERFIDLGVYMGPLYHRHKQLWLLEIGLKAANALCDCQLGDIVRIGSGLLE